MSFQSATNVASAEAGLLLTANGKGGVYWGDGGAIPTPEGEGQVLVSNAPGTQPEYEWKQSIVANGEIFFNSIYTIPSITTGSSIELNDGISIRYLNTEVGEPNVDTELYISNTITGKNPSSVPEGGDTQIATTAWVIALLQANGIDPTFPYPQP
jgi:hypothetical protein